MALEQTADTVASMEPMAATVRQPTAIPGLPGREQRRRATEGLRHRAMAIADLAPQRQVTGEHSPTQRRAVKATRLRVHRVSRLRARKPIPRRVPLGEASQEDIRAEAAGMLAEAAEGIRVEADAGNLLGNH